MNVQRNERDRGATVNNTWTSTETRLHGEVVGFKRSTYCAGVWFVATVNERGERVAFVGQVELVAGVYFAYEYPEAEAAAEGAQDAEVGDALTLEEALALYTTTN